MKKIIREKIEKIREEKKLSIEKFCQLLNITEKEYLSGCINEIDQENLIKNVCRKFNINYSWLTMDIGDKFLRNGNSDLAYRIQILCNKSKYAEDYFRQLIKIKPTDKQWQDLSEKLTI